MQPDSTRHDDFYAVQHRHFAQCLREARVVAIVWVAELVYVSVVTGSFGYIPPSERPDVPRLVLGMPAWVFWGLFVPWCVQIGVAWWFALRMLKDDEPLSTEELDSPRVDVPPK